jgi:hypothetical protein
MDFSDPRTLSSSTSALDNTNGVPMKDVGSNSDVEANSGSSGVSTPASDDAQAGVKNIEAVSMTWTKWALIAAYARFVAM